MKKLILFIAILLLPAMAQATMGTTVTYNVDGKPHEGYYVSAAKDAPLVLLVHDWDGLTDYERTRAHMLADLGYSVFAVDMFGAGVRPTETADKKALTGALYKDRARMRALLTGAIDAAEKSGANVGNAVAMGYCFGGAVTLELARSGADMKGFVSFHGGLTTPEGQDYSMTRGTLLVLHGTADKAVSMSHFAALANQLEVAGLEHEMITYSSAPHAFTVFGSPRYHEAADKKSWARFVDYLEQTLR